MTYETLNRRLTILAAVFALLGVTLGAIALATNYWTIRYPVEPILNGTSVNDQREYGYIWNVWIVYPSSINNYYMDVIFFIGSFSNMQNRCRVCCKILGSNIYHWCIRSFIFISWWYFFSI